MNTNDDRSGMVPEWLIERLAAGDLPPARAREVQQQMEREPYGKERLARIAASNAEILAAHPPETVAAEIRRRAAEADRRAAAAANAKRSTWVLAIPLVAAAMAILVIWIRPPRPPETVTQESDERIKGTFGLHVYRKIGQKIERLSEGAPTHAGDELQLIYSADGRRYGAVLSLDGAGRVTFHLPESGGTAAPLKTGQVTLPQSYQLDAAPGFERFLIVAGDAPFDTSGLADVIRGAAKAPAGTKTFAFTVRKETP